MYKVTVGNGMDSVEMEFLDRDEALKYLEEEASVFKSALKGLAIAVPITQEVTNTPAPIVTRIEAPVAPRQRASLTTEVCPKCGQNSVRTITTKEPKNPANLGKRFKSCGTCKQYWEGLDGWVK